MSSSLRCGVSGSVQRRGGQNRPERRSQSIAGAYGLKLGPDSSMGVDEASPVLSELGLVGVLWADTLSGSRSRRRGAIRDRGAR